MSRLLARLQFLAADESLDLRDDAPFDFAAHFDK